MHRRTFSQFYDFAGKYRNINISKGYSAFCQVRFLEQTSKSIFQKLENDNYLKDYSDKPKEIFVQKISYYMCELIALHPFYELNGRIIRLFFDMIVTFNGYEYIDYEDALKIVDSIDIKYFLSIKAKEALRIDTLKITRIDTLKIEKLKVMKLKNPFYNTFWFGAAVAGLMILLISIIT